jgi:signal transduction histidine kinase
MSAARQADGAADPMSNTVVAMTVGGGFNSGAYTQARESAPPGSARQGRSGLTVRAKLALVYGGLFVVTGLVLTTVAYLFVQWRLNHPRADLPAWCSLTQAERAAGQKLTVLQTAECTRIVRTDTLHDILISFLIGLGITALVAFLIAYWVAGRVLRPLSRVTDTARWIAARPDEARQTRIALAGPPDELRELADTFDEMLDRLDTAFESQRRFTGNASHELRTPLAIKRTLLEVALADPDIQPQTEQLARAVLTANERSERMVEGLLALAKAQNALLAPQPVGLADVAAQTLGLCEGEAVERSVRLRADLGPVSVLGDAALLERVATNLVQNAMRYNVPGGWVDVVTHNQASHGLLVVANSGPQVPEEAVAMMFEPFRRLQPGPGAGPGAGAGAGAGAAGTADRGAGLGLSIVRAVVSAHHGRIAVQPRPDGGLIVRVWIPAA